MLPTGHPSGTVANRGDYPSSRGEIPQWPPRRRLPIPECDSVLDEIRKFLTGVRAGTPANRELGTPVFTEFVGSTDLAAEIGNVRWLKVHTANDAPAQQNLAA